ncbi:MAG: hypothetical protein ACLTK0_04280 [Anaerovoracaceae bacterium]
MRSERKQEEKKQNTKNRFAWILAIIYIIAMVNVLPLLFYNLIPGASEKGRQDKKRQLQTEENGRVSCSCHRDPIISLEHITWAEP